MVILIGEAMATEVQSALHEGTWSADAIAWRSTITLDGGAGRVPLAVPVPGLDVSAGGTAVAGDDGIVAIDVASGTRTITLDTVQHAGDGLYPPLVAGGPIQRITLSGADWDPDPRLGMERHVSRTSMPDISDAQCSDGLPVVGPHPICVVADDRVIASRGLPGEVRPRDRTPFGVAVAIAAAFGTVVGGLVFGNRLLARHARSERIDAYLKGGLGAVFPVEGPREG
jgi:hypothetical protein